MVRIGKINLIALLLVQFVLVWSVSAATGLAGSSITIEGQRGEFLTGGRRWAFQAPNHTVGINTRALVAGSTAPSEFTIGAADATRDEYIDIEFDSTLSGEPVKPGVYQTRRGFPTGEKGTEFNISMVHRGCSQSASPGVVTVKELEYQLPNDDDPTVRPHITRFVADFTFRCDSSSPVTGTINFIADPLVDGLPPTDEPEDPEDPDPTPPPPSFQVVLPTDLAVEPLVVSNNSTHTVDFSTAIDSTFNSDVQLFVVSSALEEQDLDVTLTPALFPAPGAGEGKITIHTGPLTFPRDYVVTVFASSAEAITGSSFIVRVDCTPPFILGVDQPRSVAGVASGTQTTLEVKPGGSGPFFYQWYRGMPGMTNSPVQAENNARLVLTARESGPYWVRVRNACGSVDSSAALVTVATQPLSARRGARP